MHIAYRSYLTAGVAALGVGAIALTPIQPIPNQPPLAAQKAVTTLAVNLAATVNPFELWKEVAQTSFTSFMELKDAWTDNPFPILNQFLANQNTYFKWFPDISAITTQFFDNLGNFIKEPITPGPPTISPPPPTNGNISPVETSTSLLLQNHVQLWNTLTILSQIQPYIPLLELTTTPISGALLGFAGPGLSSMIQFGESFKAMVDAFKAHDFATGFNELINIPARVVDAGLNGGKFLNLLPLVEKLVPDLPPGTLTRMGIALGGVLTAFPYTKPAPGGIQAGGVAFDSVDTTVKVLISEVSLPGIPIGLFGGLMSTADFMAKSIYVDPNVKPSAATAGASTAPKPLAAASVAEAPTAPAPTPAVATASTVVDAPAPAETPAVAPAPAPAETPVAAADPVVAPAAPVVEAPTQPSASAAAPQDHSAAADNDGNGGNNRGGHKGARGKHHAG